MDSGQIDALIESKQKRATRGTYEEPETSPEPAQDDDDYGGPSSIRKKTRKGKATNTGEARPSPIPLKRKRGTTGGKSMSVTPSIADNEDDIPDLVSLRLLHYGL